MGRDAIFQTAKAAALARETQSTRGTCLHCGFILLTRSEASAKDAIEAHLRFAHVHLFKERADG